MTLASHQYFRAQMEKLLKWQFSNELGLPQTQQHRCAKAEYSILRSQLFHGQPVRYHSHQTGDRPLDPQHGIQEAGGIGHEVVQEVKESIKLIFLDKFS